MKALVTGGAGFIGSHLVERLVKDGHEVWVLDDLSNGHVENLTAVRGKIHFQEGDVRDLATVSIIARQVDTIFHLATRCLVQGLEDPITMHSVNDLGTYNICLAAKKHGCKIVYVGTSEQYGSQTEFPIKETNPMKPRSIYGLTKGVAEKYVSWHYWIHKVPAVCLRVFNTYGPRHREDSYAAVITEFMKCFKDNKPLTIHGDGKQTREYTYISDVIDGIMLLSKLEHGEIVNIGSGLEVSILYLAYLTFLTWLGIEKTVNMTIDPGVQQNGLETIHILEPHHVDPRPNDLRRLYADITRARSYGYEPKVSLTEGLRMYVAWFKEKYNASPNH